jgi:hypothetical protein
MTNKPLCVISAPVFTRSGYGDLSTDLCKSLLRYKKDEWEILINPQRWGGCQPVTIDDNTATDEDRLLLSKFMRENLTRQPDVYIRVSIPSEFDLHGKYNIGITAGIESAPASADFMEGINRPNLTIVTSNFTKQVFEDTSYLKKYPDGRQEQLKSTKPIEVCFWGTDPKLYTKTADKVDSIESVLGGIPENFAFLFVGQWTHGGIYNDRKDIGNLVKTFLTAFKDREYQPCLLLKTSGVNFSETDKNEMLKKLKTIEDDVRNGNLTCKLPKCYLLHGEMTPQEINALYNHEKIKAFVSFTHGEGFGKSLLDISFVGKPILVSNWSGHLDFLNPKYTTLLEGSVKQIDPASANQWLIKESSWFTVSYSLAEEKLRQVFYHYSDKLLEKAEQLRLENMEKFSLSAMDRRFWSILDQYVPRFVTEKKIVLPSLKKIELPKLRKAE